MKQENSNSGNLFNLSINNVDLKDPEKQDSILYRPTADKGKDGIYKSLIRFLPIKEHPQTPYIRKFQYWLEDAEGIGHYIDSPSTVGETCPIQSLFFKLRNSESAYEKELSEGLKRREVFYSLIQIVKDPFDPEMEGKIKIFKYGITIKNKIDAELKADQSELDDTDEKVEPTIIWDLFEGKNFELNIKKKNNFNNYDDSKFKLTKSPIVINGEKMSNNKEDQVKILDYLKTAPDIQQFAFKHWDDNTKNMINEILAKYKSPGVSVDKITSTISKNIDIKNENKTEVKNTNSDSLSEFLNDIDV